MIRKYRPLTAAQKAFVRRNYGQMTVPQLADRMGVETRRLKNYIDNQRKVGAEWTAKTREQKSLNCFISGQKGAIARWKPRH